jgi:hypothetical protein
VNRPDRIVVMPIERALPAQMIDEAERLAYFDQSARTVGGKVAEYIKPEPVQVASRAA